jgi:signal peptidase I
MSEPPADPPAPAAPPPAEDPLPTAAPPGAAPSPAAVSALRRPLLLEYLEALLIAVVFATFARTFVVQAFKIPSASMEKDLLVGDHILVNKFIYGPTRWPLERWLLPVRPPRRGDVVVFKFPQDPTRDFIKRCVGLPGDVVELVDKGLSINGEPVKEGGYTYFTDTNVYRSRLVEEPYRLRDNFGPYRVPRDHYFFLGDNRDNSNDSRYWGPAPASYVKGRAFLIYWSVATPEDEEEGGGSGDGSALARRLRRLARAVVDFPTATRWGRSFQLVR